MIAGFLAPTWMHRLPAGGKLLALVLATVAILRIDDPYGAALVLVAAFALYGALGRAALRRLTGLRALLPLLVVVAVLQIWIAGGWRAGAAPAFVSAARILAMIALADLVTATTTTQAIIDALSPLLAPLARFGAPTHRIALAVALVIRFVPVLLDLWRRREEAWRARTGRRGGLALAAPFVADALRLADRVGEALDARIAPQRPGR